MKKRYYRKNYSHNLKSQLALKEAINIAGNQALLAKICGESIKQQHISYWLHHKVPAEYVLKIERATGVNRTRLRPDIYPE